MSCGLVHFSAEQPATAKLLLQSPNRSLHAEVFRMKRSPLISRTFFCCFYGTCCHRVVRIFRASTAAQTRQVQEVAAAAAGRRQQAAATTAAGAAWPAHATLSTALLASSCDAFDCFACRLDLLLAVPRGSEHILVLLCLMALHMPVLRHLGNAVVDEPSLLPKLLVTVI